MKIFVITLLSVCVFGISAFAQSTRSTRPRIIPTPTPAIPQNDLPVGGNAKRPPVLGGETPSTQNPATRPPVLRDTNPKNQPQPAKEKEGAGGEDREVIRIDTNLVTMPVSVLDRDGRIIAGLRQQEFQIFENGVQQTIEYFQSVEQPFTVILLIDVSPSTAFQIDEIHDGAIAFVNQLRPDDKVMVIAFDESVHILSPITNDRRVLHNAIREAQFGDGTGLYEAVGYVINRQLKQIQGRKAVVIFTDGVDTTSRGASYQSTIGDAEETDAPFYLIRYDTMNDVSGGYNPRRRRGGGIIGVILGGGNVGGGGPMAEEYETGKRYLEDLARNSGGRNFEARNDLTAAFSGIAEELRQQYSIGYYPESVGQTGERRQIRVRVMRPNLVVRAKTSYVVGANAGRK